MTDLIKNQKSEKICVLRDPCLPPGSAVNWNHGPEHGLTSLCPLRSRTVLLPAVPALIELKQVGKPSE